MNRNENSGFLTSVEANHRELLYKARWDKRAAAEIVPPLVKLLASGDEDLVARALVALHRIGPAAQNAARAIIPLLNSSIARIADNAALTLAHVSLQDPQLAIKPLTELASKRERLPYAMFGLIELGPAASIAGPVFVKAYGDNQARIRRLALRGLKECRVEAVIAVPILKRAASDRSKAVAAYAAKIMKLYAPAKGD